MTGAPQTKHGTTGGKILRPRVDAVGGTAGTEEPHPWQELLLQLLHIVNDV